MMANPAAAIALQTILVMPEGETPNAATFITALANNCPIDEPVADIVETSRMMLAVGIPPDRLAKLEAVAKQRPATTTTIVSPSATAWMQQGHLISTRMPEIDLLHEPRDPAFFDTITSLVIQRREALVLAQARQAAHAVAKAGPTTTFGHGSGAYSRIDNALRPFFFELVQRWLPDGELESASEWRALNTYRADRRRGLNVHVGDDDKLGLWRDGGRGHGRGIIALAAYLFDISKPQALHHLDGMLRGLPTHDARFAPVVGSVPLAQAHVAVDFGDHCPTNQLPFREDIERCDVGEVIDCWAYSNAQDLHVGLVVRYKKTDGDKTYRLMSPFRDRKSGVVRWCFAEPHGMIPLYRLPSLLRHPLDAVVVVEGEKTADALTPHLPDGWQTTTWLGGADNAKRPDLDLDPLRGRHVLLWPDNDERGHAAMAAMALRLQGIAASIGIIGMEALKRLRGSDVPRKWDAADAISEGWDKAYMSNILSQPA